MTIQEHIEYWIRSSNDDFEVFNLLLNAEKYLHCLFIGHLCLEKLIKAHWVKDNSNSVPPKIHNLITLLKQTNLKLDKEYLIFLTQLNDFQIEGRYPDYKFKILKLLTKDYVNNILPTFYAVRECLITSII